MNERTAFLDWLDKFHKRLTTNERIAIADKAQWFWSRCDHCCGSGEVFVTLHGIDVCPMCHGSGSK